MASGGSLDGSIRLALLSQNLEIKANFDSFLQTLKPNEIQNLVKDLILALTENPIDEKGIKELTSSILSQIISDPGKLLLLINKLTPAQLDSLVESLPDLKATVEMLTNTLKADSPEKTDGTVKLLQSMLQNNIPLKELLNSNPQLLNLLTGSNINNLMKLESSQDDTELVANISAMLNSAKKEQKETNLKINILLGKFINKKSIQGQSANKQPTAEDNDTESES